MKFDQPPDDVEWNEWGPPVRVEIEHSPVMLFARAVKDDCARLLVGARPRPTAGFERVPVPPTLHVRDGERGRVSRHPAAGRNRLDVRERRRRRGERVRP